MKKIIVLIVLATHTMQLQAMELVPTLVNHTLATVGLVPYGIHVVRNYYNSNTSSFDRNCTDATPEVVEWIKQSSFKGKPMPFTHVKMDPTIPSLAAMSTVDKKILYLPENLFILYRTVQIDDLHWAMQVSEINISKTITNQHRSHAETKRLEELAAMIPHEAAHIYHQDTLFRGIYSIAIPLLGQTILHAYCGGDILDSIVSGVLMALSYENIAIMIDRFREYRADRSITDIDNAIDWLKSVEIYEELCMAQLSVLQRFKIRMYQIFLFHHPSEKNRIAALLKIKKSREQRV
jgi:Peptidase family M48